MLRNCESQEGMRKKCTAVPYIFEIVIFVLLFELALIVFYIASAQKNYRLCRYVAEQLQLQGEKRNSVL